MILPIVIAGGIALYLATRHPAGAPHKPPAQPPPDQPPAQPPVNPVSDIPAGPNDPTWVLNRNIPDVGGAALAKGKPATVKDAFGLDQPNDFMANNASASDGVGWREQFIAEVWEPAAKIHIEDLTAEDFADAFTFLGGGGGNQGKFVRRDDIGSRFQIGLGGIVEAKKGQETATIVGAIESVIPIAGAALSAVTNSAQPALQGAIGDIAADLGNIVSVAVSDKSLAVNPAARAIMRPSRYYGDETLQGVIYKHTQEDGEAILTRSDLNTAVALDGPSGEVAGSSFQGGRRVHLQLLTRTPYGWFFPWLCFYFDGIAENIHGDAATVVGYADRINRRARIYRAIDLLICKAFPYGPPQRSDVYFYTSKKFGPILGSIFPPRMANAEKTWGDKIPPAGQRNWVPDIGEDVDFYYDSKGQGYNWDGEPGVVYDQKKQAADKAAWDGPHVPQPPDPHLHEAGHYDIDGVKWHAWPDPQGVIAKWRTDNNGAYPDNATMIGWWHQGLIPQETLVDAGVPLPVIVPIVNHIQPPPHIPPVIVVGRGTGKAHQIGDTDDSDTPPRRPTLPRNPRGAM